MTLKQRKAGPKADALHVVFLEIHGTRFVVLPEEDYRRLQPATEEELPASLLDMSDLVDADEAFGKALGISLKAARTEAGLTQEQLAKKIHRSQALVSGVERGTVDAGEGYASKVLKACGLPADWSPHQLVH